MLFVEEFPQRENKTRVLHSEKQGGGLTATALVAAARLGASLDDAGTVVGGGLVGKALHEYAEISALPHLTAIAGRSNRIIEGATVALTAYVRADADMARQAQASASTLAADGSGLGRVSGLDGGGSLSWGGRRSPERG